MKITTCPHSTPEIEIIEISGELTGMDSVRLEEYLYASLDEGRLSKIINLKQTKKADGLGLDVLENFINRGMRFRFINAGLEILNLLTISGKEDLIKLYNCQKPHEAVLLFEKETLEEEKSILENDDKGRRFQRVNTSLKTEFNGHASHNDGDIAYRAVIDNLSDGGFLISKINAFNKNKEKHVNVLQMAGRELCDINFSLNGDSKLIETNGECVWETNVNEELYVGVRFKNMKLSHNEAIKNYVSEQKNS
jgi:hypothetical protein